MCAPRDHTPSPRALVGSALGPMGLSSLQLDAFFTAARTRNFSRAAKELHITQSALTQRIGNLEAELGLAVFIRKPRGVELTEAGSRMLRYCQARDLLEKELLEELSGDKTTGLGGVLRVAGFSSVVRSVLLPALTPLLRAHPNVQVHLQNAEMEELPRLLNTGEVDLIVLDHVLAQADVEAVPLGEEENVLVASRDLEPREAYLDHDPHDPTTAKFLRLQSDATPTFRRSYLDEIYALIDGAATGLGKAVVPRHLAALDDRLRIVPGHKPMRSPVILHHFRQPFYTALQTAAIAELRQRCGALLTAPAPLPPPRRSRPSKPRSTG
jgi:DNA-binding transcriptional LysR family regulator